jgi:4-hydroxy-2-oxoheptanedioate aldolase
MHLHQRERFLRSNQIIDRVKSGQPALGGWMAINSPYAAELMGHSGFDTVVVDLQHGPFFLDAAVPMLQALSATPAMPMARCSANNFFEINKLLDAGAYSIICPMIDTAEDAARFVGACRYPPMGTRSYGPTRGFLYGGADYFEHANSTILTWGMVETPQALQELDAIAATPGLDGIFIGPADLSLALGVAPPPQHSIEPLAGALARIIDRTHAAGKLVGCFCTTEKMSIDLKKMGADFLTIGMDSVLLRTSATERVNAVRKA